MASSTQESRLRLTAVDETDAAARHAAQNLEKIGAAARRVKGDLEMRGQIDAMTRRLAGAGAALFSAAVIKDSVKEYAAMERRFTRIAINAETSAGAIDKNRAMIFRMAEQTAQPINEMVEGFEEIVRATGNLSQAEQLFPTVARASQALGASVKDTALTAQVMNDTFKISADQIPAAFDAIAKAGNAGKFEAKDLATYMNQLAPIMTSIGYKGLPGLQKTVSLLEIIRNQTGSAEEAFTALRDITQRLATPEMEGNFQKQGVNLRAALDSARRSGGDLLATFQNVTKETLKQMGYYRNIPAEARESLLATLFPEKDSRAAMLSMLQMNNQLVDMIDNVKNHSAGSIESANQRLLDDAASHIQRLENEWLKFKLQLGSTVYDLGGQLGIDSAVGGLQMLEAILKTIQITASKIGELMPSIAGFKRGMAESFGVDVNGLDAAAKARADAFTKTGKVGDRTLGANDHPYVKTDALINDLLPRIQSAGKALNDARNKAFMSGSRDPERDARNDPGALRAEKELQMMQQQVEARTRVLTEQETKDFGRAGVNTNAPIEDAAKKAAPQQLQEQKKTNELLHKMSLKSDLVLDRGFKGWSDIGQGSGGGAGGGGGGGATPSSGGGGSSGSGTPFYRGGGGAGNPGAATPAEPSVLNKAGIAETKGGVGRGLDQFSVDGLKTNTDGRIGSINPNAFTGPGAQPGNLSGLIEKVSKDAGIPSEIMQGIRAGESKHTNQYDHGDIGNGEAYGPFQLNMGAGRLGDRFQKATGFDPRDPRTIGEQAKWVAKYIAMRRAKDKNYDPSKEWFGYMRRQADGTWLNRHGEVRKQGDPSDWGNSGYVAPAGEQGGGSVGAFGTGGFNMPPVPKTETPATDKGTNFGPSLPADNARRLVTPEEGHWKDGANLFSRGKKAGTPGANLVTIKTLDGKRVTVNAEAAPAFKALADDLQKSGYKINTIGGYAMRGKAGGGGISEHAYGNAIDINAGVNAMDGSGRTDMPKDILQRARKYGLTWGGSKDPMHFEWLGKPLQLPKVETEAPTPEDLTRAQDDAYASGANPFTRGRSAQKPAAEPSSSGIDFSKAKEALDAEPKSDVPYFMRTRESGPRPRPAGIDLSKAKAALAPDHNDVPYSMRTREPDSKTPKLDKVKSAISSFMEKPKAEDIAAIKPPPIAAAPPPAVPAVPDLSEHHRAIDALHEKASKPITIKYNHEEGIHAALQSKLTLARDHREAKARTFSDVGVA